MILVCRILLPALFLALLASAASAQQADDWQNKPWEQWTKKDAQRVLSESPWAKTEARSGPTVKINNNEIITADKIYTLRLRSALTVRRALLRLRQLDEKYDQMSDKKKSEFDEKNKALVECPACADNYIISLLPPSSADTRNVTLEKLRLYVRLTDDRGRSRELVHFNPTKVTGAEVVLFFPRLDEKNEALFTGASKKIIFTIETTALNLDAVLRRFEFDVSKIMTNGRVDF